MNYYEELGLTPQANSHEIHQAHKHLARLFHPDRWQDEDSRRLAECQMKRLNAVCEVLSNPEKRAEYDRAMFARNRLSMSQPCTGAAAYRHWGWFAKALRAKNVAWRASVVLGGLILAWLALRERPPAPPPPLVPSVAVAGAPAASAAESGGTIAAAQPAAVLPPAPGNAQNRALARENDGLRQQVAELREEIRRTIAESAQLKAQVAAVLPPSGDNSPRVEAVAPLGVADEANGNAAGFPAVPQAPGSRFGGTWVYVASSESGGKAALYPPEYIEVVILEQAGQIKGRYRGRYHVKDQAISPDVNFNFQGLAADGGALEWTGQGGARGQLALERLDNDSLRVTWFASQLGPRAGLVSGAATLVRLRGR